MLFARSLAVSIVLLFAFCATAMADTYEIPVITGGKVITLTVDVEGGQIASATASKGVLLGKVKRKEPELPVLNPGYWPQQIPDALNLVEVKKDEFTGITFYTSRVPVTGQSEVYPYVGTDGKSVWLRFLAILVTGDPMTIDRCTIVADDKRFTLDFPFSAVDTRYLGNQSYFSSGDIKLASAEEKAMLDAVAKAEKVTIRFYERSRTYDHALGKDEQRAFAESLAVYELLGGNK